MLLRLVPQINQKRIILGSASPRRSEILRSLGLRFEVIPSQFAEDLEKNNYKHATDYVLATAKHKAEDIYTRNIQNSTDDVIIICADTIVVLGDKILEKPSSKTHAFEMLKSLSGNQHVVYTAVHLIIQEKSVKKEVSFFEATEVTFAQLSDEMITAYIDTGIPMDKAGSYGIQDVGGSFVEKINGCYYNVMGFPMHRFCKQLSSVLTLS
eukprot:TRINITY_DN4658_c0_g1_i2.p1 TRINITY_DN4658_c0_g1~~TRINITY_DN4658_c0_g1_i2.p1  ORF type:complete len:210 (-),score=29.43 TRINITY_DN4658_c0_g1_i2:26-655(-)